MRENSTDTEPEKKITASLLCRRLKKSCMSQIHRHFIQPNKENGEAQQRNFSQSSQTDRQVGRQSSFLSDVTSDRLGLAADDRLQKQGGRKWNKERKREREQPAHPYHPPPPTPFELREAAGLEKAEGRKGSDGCLLFELCALRFQPQYTLTRAWLFISSQYPCRRRQAAALFIIAYIMETQH